MEFVDDRVLIPKWINCACQFLQSSVLPNNRTRTSPSAFDVGCEGEMGKMHMGIGPAFLTCDLSPQMQNRTTESGRLEK
jgi:hypothetical protein